MSSLRFKFIFRIGLILFILFSFIIVMLTNPVIAVSSIPEKQVPVNVQRLTADVNALTQGKPRSVKYPDALEQAAAYIISELQKLNLPVEEQKFMVDGKEYKNIICSFGPADKPRLIIGAHYDVCGDTPGADDNASGTAGLLEIARLLKSEMPSLTYRTDLVFYTLEEPPYFRTEHMGSAVHAKSLHSNNIKVKAMISLEMIGYFSDASTSQDYPLGILKLFYPSKANYIAVVGKLGQGRLVRTIKKSMVRGSAIDVQSINAPKSIPGIDFSDHLNYWKYGYPAVMITNTSFYRNSNYHELGDTPATLDFEKMGEVVKGVYHTITTF